MLNSSETTRTVWRRWHTLTALRERHNLTDKATKFRPKAGDTVIVNTENKNPGRWLLAIVDELYPGKDGIIRVVQVKTASRILERPVQHLCPLELSCNQARDTRAETPIADLNPKTPTSVEAKIRCFSCCQG